MEAVTILEVLEGEDTYLGSINIFLKVLELVSTSEALVSGGKAGGGVETAVFSSCLTIQSGKMAGAECGREAGNEGAVFPGVAGIAGGVVMLGGVIGAFSVLERSLTLP